MLDIIVPVLWILMVMSYVIGIIMASNTYYAWTEGYDSDITYSVSMAGLFFTVGNWINWHTLI
jgi:hypothetical protein